MPAGATEKRHEKITVPILTAIFVVTAICFAQDANQMKYIQLVPPVAAAASSNTAVSVAAYKGNATFLVQFAPATEACSNIVTLKHCATAAGAYVIVTNTAGTACSFTQVGPTTTDVQTISIDMARLHPFVRAYTDHTTQTNAVSALLIAPIKSE